MIFGFQQQNVRRILETKNILPQMRQALAIPRDEQFSIAPPGYCLFVLWGFDDNQTRDILMGLRDKVPIYLCGNNGSALTFSRLTAETSRLYCLPDSYLQLGNDQQWPKEQILPTHVFVNQKAPDDDISRFLRDLDDLIVQHAFPRDHPTDKTVDDIHFLLHHASIEKLDTRRYTWISKNNAPKYSSKALRRGDVDPYDNTLEPFVITAAPRKLMQKYATLKQTHGPSMYLNSNLKSIDDSFDLSRFEEAKSPPVCFDTILHERTFETTVEHQCQDLLIKAPNTAALIPRELYSAKEFLEKAVTHFMVHSREYDEYYAYLTLTQGDVPSWGTQRRVGLHADGFFSGKAGRSELIKGRGKETNEIIYLCCNAIPPVFYLEPIPDIASDLDRNCHDFWVAIATRTSIKPSPCLKPYEIAMMDGYCVHAVATNQTLSAIPRTFMRLVFSKEKYTLSGNTRNPHFAGVYEQKNWEWEPLGSVQKPTAFWHKVQDLFSLEEPRGYVY